LFVADGYLYGGKSFATDEKNQQVLHGLSSIEKCVLVPYLDEGAAVPDLSSQTCWLQWRECLGSMSQELAFTQLPFDHPLYILYSSGTTGIPKCIVHGSGGTLLQHLKEHSLHVNIGPEDKVFYFTTLGWMMWNWLVSALALGSTLVLYDGSPFHPSGDILWNIVDAERIAVFGTSAKYLSALQKADVRPLYTHKLDSLHTILSTRSPLMPDSFDYVYQGIKRDICLSSISGGTDIVSCFVLGNPTLPVYAGEIQCKGLGMNVQVFDETGASLENQKGELVCTASFPSMPVGFVNDADGSRYHEAYFARYPGVWHQGDYAEITSRGGVVIYGRSDSVLNPGGIRIGTAEIYRQVALIPQVLESVAIAQKWESDVRIILFARLREGEVLDENLTIAIKGQIRRGASPRHVPTKILQVSDIPRTRSGKILELAVADVVHNRVVKNIDAIANPEALELFRDRAELTLE
jgi:acetoacetyl-CoA synthetase